MTLLFNKVTASSADGATAVSNPASLRASSTTIWIAKSSSTMRTIGKLFPTFFPPAQSSMHKRRGKAFVPHKRAKVNIPAFREFHRAAGGRAWRRAKNKAASAVGGQLRPLGVRCAVGAALIQHIGQQNGS